MGIWTVDLKLTGSGEAKGSISYQRYGYGIEAAATHQIQSGGVQGGRRAAPDGGGSGIAAKAHEVRLKIICTSVCQTDVTFWQMRTAPALFPAILGHEAVGVVESVGEGVAEVAAGDTVLPVFLAECGACADCASARSNLCSKLPLRPRTGMPRDDGTTRFADAAGTALHHFLNVSSFCEYTVVDVAHLVKVHPALPPEKASLFSCGITTGLGAAWKVADVEPGSTVAIFGLGAVGLAVAEAARIRKASRIIGVDLNSNRFQMAKRFGITDFINPKEIGDRSLSQVIKEMTGDGADYCFECVGVASVMSDAFESSRSGWGKTLILGVEKHSSPISINSLNIMHGRSISGCLMGGIKPKTDVPLLMERCLSQKVNLDDFITHEVGFNDINRAFELLIEGKSLRCIIWMDK